MVVRTKAQTFDDFEGVVDAVLVEPSNLPDKEGNQYHIVISPTSVEVGGKTGKMHQWINISAKATDTSVPEDSALDKYLQEIELLIKDTKKAETHGEVMEMLVGKKFRFVKKRLGKSYAGHEAQDYWTPAQLLK